MNSVASSTGLPPRLAAALAYAGWWVTGLIFWFVERRDASVRFHAAQAMTAFGVLALVIGALSALALASLSFLPGAFNPLVVTAQVVTVFAVLLWAVTVWRVATGASWRIPLAAGWADRLART